MRSFLAASALVGGALAQSGAWGQCGGIGYNGPTTCVSGYSCVYSNDWYSQCLPGSEPSNPDPTTTSGGSTPTSAPGKFKFLGSNEAGGEFGDGIFPGTWGKDFTFPDNNAIQVSTLPPYTATAASPDH
jgi:endoglucanase